MTTEDAEQKAAIDLANLVVRQLRLTGYDFVALSIAKLIPAAGGEVSLPGASLFEACPSIAPAMPNLARNLRLLADQLESAFLASGAVEAREGYSHVIGSADSKRNGGS